MGQAKQRGTFEERVAQSEERIAKIIVEMEKNPTSEMTKAAKSWITRYGPEQGLLRFSRAMKQFGLIT